MEKDRDHSIKGKVADEGSREPQKQVEVEGHILREKWRVCYGEEDFPNTISSLWFLFALPLHFSLTRISEMFTSFNVGTI